MKTSKQQTDTPNESQILRFEDFKEWRESHARLVELQTEQARNETRAAEIQVLLAEKSDNSRLSAVSKAAWALVTRKETPQEMNVVQLRDELAAIYEKRPVLLEAIKLQTAELRRVEAELSFSICERLMALDEKELREAAALLVDVGQRFSRLKARREALTDRSVKWLTFLRPFNFGQVVNLEEAYSAANCFLREVAERGTIPGWEDPMHANQPTPGALRTVSLLSTAAGPDGVRFRGEPFATRFGDFLVETRQAVAVEDGGLIQGLRNLRNALQPSDVEGQGGEWMPAKN